MKKLISSILALSLVAGMSVTAFATAAPMAAGGTGSTASLAWTTKGGTAQSDTVNVPVSTFNYATGGAGGAAITPNASNAMDSINALTKSWGNSIGTLNPANVITVSFAGTAAGGVDVKFAARSSNITAGTVVADYTITDGTLSYVISVDVTITTTPNALSGLKIDDVVNNGDGVQLGSTAGIKTSGMAKNGSSDVASLDILPDAEIRVKINSNDFDWTDGTGVVPQPTTYDVTTSQLRTGKITIRKSVSKGSNVIEDISFDSDKTDGCYVLIEFVEWFVSVDEQDVDFTIYLAKSGSKRSGTELTIAGTMENEQDEVDEGDDYISTEDGTVFEAQDYVRNCEVYLGNGVYITTNLFKDKKYYGIALNTYDTTDGAIMDEYPEIDNVLTLKTVNLKGSGNIVTFDMSGDYYVYGTDGTYLGLSSEAVPYSDKYYFATERINIKDGDLDDDDDDVILDEDDDDDYVGPSDGGGDDANNANDNPGTGVNGFVGVAVAAGLISLAAVGVTARKKK